MDLLADIKTHALRAQYLTHISRFEDIYQTFLYELEHTHIENLTRFCAEYQNKCIRKYIENKKSVAFFCPTKSFRSNFGNLPRQLENYGFAVLYFYGEIHQDSFEQHQGSFYISDMLIENTRLECIDCFITACIMDCLPQKPLKILIDHLSFVFYAPSFIDNQITAPSYEHFIDLKGFKPAYAPLYDYQFISSKFVLEQVLLECGFNGYVDSTCVNQSILNSVGTFKKIVMEKLSNQRVANPITLVLTGYSKIDKYMQSMSHNTVENLIIYAPTPNDDGNKKAWLSLMSINRDGKEIVNSLCESFPEYYIVFKPYIDEKREIVQHIVEANKHHKNFIFCNDENTLNLYSRAKVMVSDLSSTAFTFSLSTLRPTIFYSSHEHLIDSKIVDSGNYLVNRTKIGLVATNLNDLISKVSQVIEEAESYKEKIEKIRDEYLFNIGHSEASIFQSIVEILEDRVISCSHHTLYQMDDC